MRLRCTGSEPFPGRWTPTAADASPSDGHRQGRGRRDDGLFKRPGREHWCNGEHRDQQRAQRQVLEEVLGAYRPEALICEGDNMDQPKANCPGKQESEEKAEEIEQSLQRIFVHLLNALGGSSDKTRYQTATHGCGTVASNLPRSLRRRKQPSVADCIVIPPRRSSFNSHLFNGRIVQLARALTMNCPACLGTMEVAVTAAA